jgi:hypothetical protein
MPVFWSDNRVTLTLELMQKAGRGRREGFCALLLRSNSFGPEKISDAWNFAISAVQWAAATRDPHGFVTPGNGVAEEESQTSG